MRIIIKVCHVYKQMYSVLKVAFVTTQVAHTDRHMRECMGNFKIVLRCTEMQ